MSKWNGVNNLFYFRDKTTAQSARTSVGSRASSGKDAADEAPVKEKGSSKGGLDTNIKFNIHTIIPA